MSLFIFIQASMKIDFWSKSSESFLMKCYATHLGLWRAIVFVSTQETRNIRTKRKVTVKSLCKIKGFVLEPKFEFSLNLKRRNSCILHCLFHSVIKEYKASGTLCNFLCEVI